MEADTRTLDAAAAARVASLVRPLSLEQFMVQTWPAKFAYFAGNGAGLAELIEQPELRDIEALVNCPKQGVTRADFNHLDRPSEEDITSTRALQLYKETCTIYITRLATEVMLRWNRDLDSTFGLIPGTTQINAFASLAGMGAYWHWDAQEIFIVQVRGRKRWRFAANEYLEWPTNGGQAGVERLSEFRHQLTNPDRPVEAPKQWQTVELAPGDVLFVPRGYWHSTENIEESLHLVLQMQMPSWRDVFRFLFQNVPGLYSLEWRRPARGLHPQQLLTTGLKEFQDRQADLASFATSEGIVSLARLFSSVKSTAPTPPG